MKKPIICHIPHSSIYIPKEYYNDYLVDISFELLQMTDLYTDDLFDFAVESLVFPISRLVCDVERFRNDELEPMAKIGMGVVYTKNHKLLPLRDVSLATKNQILEKWYDLHHSSFGLLVDKNIQEFGRCLIIDCHSFPTIPLPYEEDQSLNRPDICIGTDCFHTPEKLASTLENEFRLLGYDVCRNRPFSGAIVPLRHYKTNKNVVSIMIEVNRSLYMDENGQKNANYANLKNDLKRVFESIVKSFENDLDL